MKPRLIGITGGMGSGKSTVSKILRHLNYKVYNSDVRGKELMGEVRSIRDQLESIFGDEIFNNNKLDAKALSRKVFKDDSSLQKINWAQENESYIWGYFVENDFLFNSGNELKSRFITFSPFSKFNLECFSHAKKPPEIVTA